MIKNLSLLLFVSIIFNIYGMETENDNCPFYQLEHVENIIHEKIEVDKYKKVCGSQGKKFVSVDMALPYNPNATQKMYIHGFRRLGSDMTKNKFFACIEIAKENKVIKRYPINTKNPRLLPLIKEINKAHIDARSQFNLSYNVTNDIQWLIKNLCFFDSDLLTEKPE